MATLDAMVRPSPLGDLLRARVLRVLTRLEQDCAPERFPGQRALQRFLAAIDELAAASDALCDGDSSPAPVVLVVSREESLARELNRALGAVCEVRVAAAPDGATFPATSGVAVAAGAKAARALREVHPGLRLVVIASEPEAAALADELAGQPVVILREPAPAAIALAVRALLAAPPSSVRAGARAPGPGLPEPRSYAHLAGLLPRTLERAIAFDVGVAIVARAGGDPVIDVHARPHCSADQVEAVRERAVSLYRLMRGGVQADDLAAMPALASFRSSLHAPLVTEGRVAGLTYLASLHAGAFAEGDEQVLVDLTTHASGAYRRLESSVTRLRVTPRQAQILALVAAGLGDKEIAAKLNMAHRTVRTHLDRLMHEHGLRSRTEAVTAWLRGQQQ